MAHAFSRRLASVLTGLVVKGKIYPVGALGVLSLLLLSSCLSMPRPSSAEPVRYWIMSIEEWNSVSVNMYGDDDTRMANGLLADGWDLFRLTDVGVVLKQTDGRRETRIIGIDQWNEIAKEKHNGSDTDMANALAGEGWEITDMSLMGVVLKRNRNAGQVLIYGFDEWNAMVEARHKGSDTEALNAQADQGWELVQLSQLGVVLQRR